MTPQPTQETTVRLEDAVRLSVEKLLNAARAASLDTGAADAPVLVLLAAGRGTRFGVNPKCIQLVSGTPLARHSIDAFRRISPSPAVCVVGYRHDEVAAALGDDNIYVRSDNPTGGTGFAAFEALSVPGLIENDALLIISMGDRIVPSSVFHRLHEKHLEGPHEADLTFLTAQYEPPKNRGKGRVVRDENGLVTDVVEERDVLKLEDEVARETLLNVTEANCPLYVIRAGTLRRHLAGLTNSNAQGQYYITDMIRSIRAVGGDIRTVTTSVADEEYDLLCADVTQPMDLALLEGILASVGGLLFAEEVEVEDAAAAIAADRPAGQVASITRQLRELVQVIEREKLAFAHGRPVGIGISGGRLRIAFMHPDMVRFYGPAWQMPIGAGSASGDEQIVMLVQAAADGRIHLFPINPKYRESVNSLPADGDHMYPGEEISDLYAYEGFGTRMSESALLALGYFSEEELQQRRQKNLPLPPASLWASSNMRRPFALVENAIASMRTLRGGTLGAKVQEYLGRDRFKGLRLVSTGNIPQGGFSSSSAVTVATGNAINALWEIGLSPDLLVHLSCQAEYGTGVRAGSLDQATEQKGRTRQGTLISSNPRENYKIIGTYAVPADRFQILFPYSVERDRTAWCWSWGAYGEGSGSGPLTTGETRKMTGKAAELCALLTRLPLDLDYFKLVESELVTEGALSPNGRRTVALILRRIPLRIGREELRAQVFESRQWLIQQLADCERLDTQTATRKADATLASLFEGWRDPRLRRTTPSGAVVDEVGVPLRAMLAYLFAEVVKNFHLIGHPEQWIECVRRSQRGDRCFDIDPERLPARRELESQLDWERGAKGPDLLNRWLERFGATPFDYNRGLDDESLPVDEPPDLLELPGSNFFRGLALIDLAEAMLSRAFGPHAVAVRVNAAGQGDYFQVHVDNRLAGVAEVKQFLRAAFYRRFDLHPATDFVEIYPGGGAVGTRLSRYGSLGQLIRRLETFSGS